MSQPKNGCHGTIMKKSVKCTSVRQPDVGCGFVARDKPGYTKHWEISTFNRKYKHCGKKFVNIEKTKTGGQWVTKTKHNGERAAFVTIKTLRQHEK